MTFHIDNRGGCTTPLWKICSGKLLRKTRVNVPFVFQRKSLQKDMLFYVPPHHAHGMRRPRTSYITYIQRLLGYHEADNIISADTLADMR